jgi:hypothetical protein
MDAVAIDMTLVALKDAMTVSSFLQLQDYTTFFTAANITT